MITRDIVLFATAESKRKDGSVNLLQVRYRKFKKTHIPT